MTDGMREAEIRRQQTGGFYRDDSEFLLHRLDEARAKVSELAVKLNEERAATARLAQGAAYIISRALC